MNEDFNKLVDRAMSKNGRTHMRPVIAKELLHYDILFSLEKEGLLDKLTFQGGTSLRLCYGSQRFSEDLDFVGGKDFSVHEMHGIKECIEKYIGNRYGLEVIVKEPKELKDESDTRDIKVDKWQIRITTAPEKKDLPKQMIKLEVANIPAYSRSPLAVKQNYEFLPDGYEDLLIMTESLDEIMADKIVSLVSCQKYIRHRDVWDLRWLKQLGGQVNIHYITSKINDYKVKNYLQSLSAMQENLPTIVRSKAFMDEMSRFIPMDVQERTLKKEKFIEFLINEVDEILGNVKSNLII